MAYAYYMEKGRLPREIDDMNMEDYLHLTLWRMRARGDEERKQKYIDDFT